MNTLNKTLVLIALASSSAAFAAVDFEELDIDTEDLEVETLDIDENTIDIEELDIDENTINELENLDI